MSYSSYEYEFSKKYPDPDWFSSPDEYRRAYDKFVQEKWKEEESYKRKIEEEKRRQKEEQKEYLKNYYRQKQEEEERERLERSQREKEKAENELLSSNPPKRPSPPPRAQNNRMTDDEIIYQSLIDYKATNDPHERAALLWKIGSCYKRLGNNEMAIQYLTNVCVFESWGGPYPDDVAWAFAMEGDKLLRSYDLNGAKEKYKKALSIHSSSFYALHGMGMISYQQRNYSDAESSLRMAYNAVNTSYWREKDPGLVSQYLSDLNACISAQQRSRAARSLK